MMKFIALTFVLSGNFAFANDDIPVVDIRNQSRANYDVANNVNEQDFALEFEEFLHTIERNYVLREQTNEFIKLSETADKAGITYQNWVLYIHRTAMEYLEIRKKYLSIISKYSVYRGIWNSDKHPLLTKKKMMMALASAFQIYDNFFSLVDAAEQNSEIRILLNQGDPANNLPTGVLEALAAQAKSLTLRNTLATQASGYYDFAHKIKTAPDDQFYSLAGIIEASPSFALFRANRFERVLKFSWIRLGDGINTVVDGVGGNVRDTQNILSMGFGNTVGLVETRKGKMHPQNNPGLASQIKSALKPLDILLEKTPFRLTDRFIPGHWGHVAIYIGSREQLVNEGLWTLITDETKQAAWKAMPQGKRQRIISALTDGHVILEALRPGVQLNSIEHFLNIDDFLAVRPDYITNNLERRAELIAQALTHFEKEYDFNFDVKTADKIVCSELAYWVFPDINWITESVLGRDSISPDNIINTVLNRNEFSTVTLYYDGNKVEPSKGNYKAELCSLQEDSTLNHIAKNCKMEKK